MLEIGSVPALRSFDAVSIYGHLCHYVCHFVCHLEHFDDNIFKIFIQIRNQSASNRLCANFEIIPRSFKFWSFVPLCVPLFCHLEHFGVNIFNSSFIFTIRVLEIGSVPILRSFYAVSIFDHLCHYVCHFVCHLEHFSDNIFKSLFISSSACLN